MADSASDAEEPTGEAEIILIPPGVEHFLYRGPLGQFEFEAWMTMEGGQPVKRAGRTVESVWLGSIRWAGDRTGEPVSDEDRTAMAAALAAVYRRERVPFDLRHPSGEAEDESGSRRPGFRSALPRAEHSEGWSLTDLFMSPEHPDPSDPPPTIVYRDESGTAEMPRRIEVVGDLRRRVLVPDGLHWVGERSGDALSEAERERILARILSVYDHWGSRYRLDRD